MVSKKLDFFILFKVLVLNKLNDDKITDRKIKTVSFSKRTVKIQVINTTYKNLAFNNIQANTIFLTVGLLS